MTSLPIDPLLPEIVRTVASNRISVLEAEPGAGKTTRVPPALLHAGLGPVYVLEPRRLAARMAAKRVAFEIGEELGDRVGYRVRFEEMSSSGTRLWYCTEGVLVRMLLGERRFEAGTVVLDEFHERHVETDVALALLRSVHPNTRLLIMSATLNAAALSACLDSAPWIQAPGRVFPVSVEYTPHSAAPLEHQVASAAAKLLEKRRGHILIFLPGAAEIRRSREACEPVARQHDAELFTLHGDLKPAEQDRALAPSARRKIICTTNVAESSVTVEGVEGVVDSGLARVRSQSAWSGFARIQVQKISRASAIQRAGRAGRTSAGHAIRLYTEAEFARFADHLQPEILRSELSELVLLLAAREFEPERLLWLDAPPEAALEQARQLLTRLRALDKNAGITEIGRRMAAIPLHPRLACFVLRASQMGERKAACDLAARLSEDRQPARPTADTHCVSDLDRILQNETSFSAERLKHRLLKAIAPNPETPVDPHGIEKALLLAYPERVARRRGETLLLAAGGSASLDRGSRARGEFVSAIEADERNSGEGPLVRIASDIKPDWLLEFFPERIHTEERLVWNRQAERVEQLNSIIYDELAIEHWSGPPSDRAAASELLVQKAIEHGISKLMDTEQVDRLMRRARFAAQHAAIEIPADMVETAVGPLATGLTSFDQLRAALANGALQSALEAALPMRAIDEIAPAHLKLPAGRRVPIEYYDDSKTPSIASRLQDFFGMRQTPAIARGAVPLTVHLLAPNRRPVQVTTDLASFWRTLYPQVRRELSRRYPKHAWPESPL